MSNMVEAGESSGKLEICFERLANQFEKDGHIEAKIKGAMTYPIVILVVVLIIFGPTQIPKLTKMFGKSVKSFKDGMEETEEDVEDSSKKVKKSSKSSKKAEKQADDEPDEEE